MAFWGISNRLSGSFCFQFGSGLGLQVASTEMVSLFEHIRLQRSLFNCSDVWSNKLTFGHSRALILGVLGHYFLVLILDLRITFVNRTGFACDHSLS